MKTNQIYFATELNLIYYEKLSHTHSKRLIHVIDFIIRFDSILHCGYLLIMNFYFYFNCCLAFTCAFGDNLIHNVTNITSVNLVYFWGHLLTLCTNGDGRAALGVIELFETSREP